MRLREIISETKQRLDPKCWKGKHKAGTKIKGGIRVNNCVPNEGVAEDFNVDDIGAAECPRCHRNDLTWNDDAQHVECRGCGAEYTEQGKEIKQGVAEGLDDTNITSPVANWMNKK